MTTFRAVVPMVCAKTNQTSPDGSQVMANIYLGDMLPASVLPSEVERLLADRFIEPVELADAAQSEAA